MFHPVLTMRARQLTAAKYADEKGIGFLAALRKVREINDDEFDTCCLQAATNANVTLPSRLFSDHTSHGLSAFGDGSIIQAILDWLKSPEGQAFISALIKLLLAALMAA